MRVELHFLLYQLLSYDQDLCNLSLFFLCHIVRTQQRLACCLAYNCLPRIQMRNRMQQHILSLSLLSFSPPLTLFNSSPLPSICCFHVSSKIFLPLTNFKYSLRVLSTIAYKHLEIIESQWADKKGSSDRAQWK